MKDANGKENRGTNRHVAELLPAYFNGTLAEHEERRVGEHLESCDSCRAELVFWRTVSGAVIEASDSAPAPPDLAMAGVWDRIEARRQEEREEEQTRAGIRDPSLRLSLARQLLLGQVALVRKEIWAASALTIGLGCLVALLISNPSSVGSPLAILAPVVAALGVAFLYGPENDPSLEVALSTPTSPRLVLLARLVLVYAYDVALVLGAALVLTFLREGVDLLPLVSLWVGPMFFLSSLALALSLFFGPTIGATVAMGLWTVKLLAAAYSAGPFAPAGSELMDAFWRANPILLPLAAILICLALFCAPRMERLAL